MPMQLALKEIKTIFSRQEKMEKELGTLKEVVRIALIEEQVRPSVLKRWERISLDLDNGRGRVFASAREMGKWLKTISSGK